MKLLLGMAMLACAALIGPAANAEDKAACAASMVCASAPETLVKVLQAEGYKAKLTKDRLGDPMIESVTNGFTFDIHFYGCAQHKKCDSLQFYMNFEKDEAMTAAIANAWNENNRFSQMSVDKDGSATLRYDVSTMNGLSEGNFKDVLAWWTSMVGELPGFYDRHLPKSEEAPARPAA